MIDLHLKPGRERALGRRHPWVLSGAVANVPDPSASAGSMARVLSARGAVLGFGHYSPASNIRVRMLTFGDKEPAPELMAERIASAIRRRASDPLLGDTNAVRLINAEGDDLPGLLVDRYADTVVVKLTSAGMALRRDEIATALREATDCASGYERADASSARREGLPSVEGPLWGSRPDGLVAIRERDRCYSVDVVGGQKTGFYLDQRDARDLVAHIAAGSAVLDLFSYTGGFGVAAALGGASSVTLVDSSAPALERASDHMTANAPSCEVSVRKADGFRFLRDLGAETSYDLIVVDPPPLARRKSDVSKASRAYKDLMLHALKHVAPGGRMLAFACSHHVAPDAFATLLFSASIDARRSPRILRELGAPSDHAVSVFHPEGRYLSGLLVEVESA